MAVKRKKAGKRGADVNKAELIREILNSESGVRNRDVIATLKLRNVEVSPAQVSNVRKSLANRGGLQLVGAAADWPRRHGRAPTLFRSRP